MTQLNEPEYSPQPETPSLNGGRMGHPNTLEFCVERSDLMRAYQLVRLRQLTGTLCLLISARQLTLLTEFDAVKVQTTVGLSEFASVSEAQDLALEIDAPLFEKILCRPELDEEIFSDVDKPRHARFRKNILFRITLPDSDALPDFKLELSLSSAIRVEWMATSVSTDVRLSPERLATEGQPLPADTLRESLKLVTGFARENGNYRADQIRVYSESADDHPSATTWRAEAYCTTMGRTARLTCSAQIDIRLSRKCADLLAQFLRVSGNQTWLSEDDSYYLFSTEHAACYVPKGISPASMDALHVAQVSAVAEISSREFGEAIEMIVSQADRKRGSVQVSLSGERDGMLVFSIRVDGGEAKVTCSVQRKLLSGDAETFPDYEATVQVEALAEVPLDSKYQSVEIRFLKSALKFTTKAEQRVVDSFIGAKVHAPSASGSL